MKTKIPSSLSYTFWDLRRLGFIDADKKIRNRESIKDLRKYLTEEDPIVNCLEIKTACKARIESEQLDIQMIATATGVTRVKINAYIYGKSMLDRLDILRLTTFLGISFKISVEMDNPPSFIG